MSYRNISLGAYTGSGNEIAAGPCFVREIFFFNTALIEVNFVLRVGADHDSALTLGSDSIATVTSEVAEYIGGGLALNSGQNLYLDVDEEGKIVNCAVCGNKAEEA